MISRAVAQAVLGREGTFSIRPEKIRVEVGDAAPGQGEHAARGTVHEVVYVGMSTRFVVDLEAGGTLMAVRQNAATASGEDAQLRGQRVTLLWRGEHEYSLG
jgi:putative spermidine/putrescine transport system ATP-binding protein